jgi:hypothetical protein
MRIRYWSLQMSRRQKDNSRSVRRVVLSTGRTIEIVCFDGRADPGEAIASGCDDLHVCRTCASPLVYPTAWEEVGERHCRLTLRCPNCERAAGGLYRYRAVERLDRELDRGTRALTRDLQQLAHANMEEDCERFIAAVHRDHILPMDF